MTGSVGQAGTSAADGSRDVVDSRGSPARTTVAYVMSRFPKLSETFVLNEIVAVENRGVEVELYPLLRERARDVHPAAEALVERANYLPFVSFSILGSQLFFLRQRPGRYLRVFADVLRGTLGSLNFFAGAVAIFPKVAHAARLMEQRRVSHVHCHFASHPALAGFIIHRLTDIPFSFTAHGSDLHVDRRMLSEKVREAAFVVAISAYNRDVIVAETGSDVAGKVVVIHCGVETARFKPARRAPDPRPFSILCIGTLHEVKGQGILIEACRLLSQRNLEFRCTIVGDGPDRPRLAQAIAEASLGERVELVGARTQDGVAALLRDVDVLAAPSVPTAGGKREGIPVVIMEALAAGVPVVASDLSGIPELVLDGVTGLLVPPADAERLADGLARLAGDPGLRARLGRMGRELVERDFDLDTNAGLLVDRFTPGRAA